MRKSIVTLLLQLLVLQLLQLPQYTCWNTEGASGARDFVGNGLGFPLQTVKTTEVVLSSFIATNTRVLLGNQTILVGYEDAFDGRNVTGAVKTFQLSDGSPATKDKIFSNNTFFGFALSPNSLSWSYISVFSTQTSDCGIVEIVTPSASPSTASQSFCVETSLLTTSTLVYAEYLTDTSVVSEITGDSNSHSVIVSPDSILAGAWLWPVHLRLSPEQVTYITNPLDSSQILMTNIEYDSSQKNLLFKCYLVRKNDNKFSQSKWNLTYAMTSSPAKLGSMYHQASSMYLIWYDRTVIAINQMGSEKWRITLDVGMAINMLAGSLLTSNDTFYFLASSSNWTSCMNFTLSGPAREMWRMLWDAPISPIAVGSQSISGQIQEQIYLVQLKSSASNPNLLTTMTRSGTILTTVPTTCNTGPQIRNGVVVCVWNNQTMSSVLMYKVKSGGGSSSSTTPSDAAIVLITFGVILLCCAIIFVIWMFVRDH